MPVKIREGVFFEMSEEEYHALPALSSTGVKNLLVSPVDFWARSWMNPRAHDEEDSIAKMIGTAFHKRVLEGSENFYTHYAIKQNFEDLPSTLEELRHALKEKNLSPKGDKQTLIMRCATEGIATAAIGRRQYLDDNEGKIFLDEDLIESIELSAAMIEKNPMLARCFQGGYAEVVIVWQENGVWFKARIDYLKAKSIIDLKTFENRNSRSVDRAVYMAMASYKYHIQAAMYLRAAEAAKRLADWYGIDQAFRDEFCACDEHGFYFIFQQKGIAPFARGYKFPRTQMWSIGNAQIEQATEIFKLNFAKYGEEQWVDYAGFETFDDDGFPAFATSDL